MDLSLERFEARLASHQPGDPILALPGRRAAVAAVLRFDRGPAEVLLMKRATRDDDRWSGQVSMPGGRHDDRDPDLVATAIRETREEVGLDLARARLLGRLDGVQAIARGKALPMTITPFVFAQEEAQAPVLGDEAAAAFWLPLDRAASGALDDTYRWHLGPVPVPMPCWRWDGFVVWGLTYRMLDGLLTLVGHD
jgi:8-oxo-dGTP pyrophosphatase MutT (NUDIX family)